MNNRIEFPTGSRWLLAQDEISIILKDLFGLDCRSAPGMENTPKRFLEYLAEFNQPQNLKELLGNGFTVRARDDHSMVVQSNIPFRMVCEHHLLPATGTTSIGYVPRKKVVGLSKLTRLVQAVGVSRPSLQEAINECIAEVLWSHMEPLGVIVISHAEHSCMACRGINAPGVITTVSTVKGVFRNVPEVRAEFFRLVEASK